ncbi:MAG: hypothetical protein QOG00_231 [Pyrinomonadaceae bacterium]|nr:hypothetical protein [Pyrinomonadaceae bacterium]
MDDHKPALLKRQALRYDLLKQLYEYVNGSQSTLVDFFGFAAMQGVARNDADDVLDYLLEEGLLTRIADEGLVTISHRGIVEIEHSLTRPDLPTEHFTTQVIQHFHGTVGAVQNAAHSTANVNQTIGTNTAEVISLLNELRQTFQALPQDKRSDALELVDGLEAEAKADSRSVARLKAMFTSILPFVSEVSANVLAATIAQSLGIKS